MKKFLLLILILGAGYYYLQQNPQTLLTITSALARDLSESDKKLQRAFENKQTKLQIGGTGKVSKILDDDLKGSHHQRFIIKLATGQTLLIAHNIDLAERIDALVIGDQIDFYGEYEWNEKGGVIHWTHHDPRGKHIAGWLVHNGKVYQ